MVAKNSFIIKANGFIIPLEIGGNFDLCANKGQKA